MKKAITALTISATIVGGLTWYGMYLNQEQVQIAAQREAAAQQTVEQKVSLDDYVEETVKQQLEGYEAYKQEQAYELQTKADLAYCKENPSDWSCNGPQYKGRF